MGGASDSERLLSRRASEKKVDVEPWIVQVLLENFQYTFEMRAFKLMCASQMLALRIIIAKKNNIIEVCQANCRIAFKGCVTCIIAINLIRT